MVVVFVIVAGLVAAAAAAVVAAAAANTVDIGRQSKKTYRQLELSDPGN